MKDINLGMCLHISKQLYVFSFLFLPNVYLYFYKGKKEIHLKEIKVFLFSFKFS